MTQLRSIAILLVLSSLSLAAPASRAAEGTTSPITVYPLSFFTATQPATAFDMLTVLPGYEFSESDSDVRGFTGAVGNVLIDGSRPAGKQESLESILRRIPATGVERGAGAVHHRPTYARRAPRVLSFPTNRARSGRTFPSRSRA